MPNATLIPWYAVGKTSPWTCSLIKFCILANDVIRTPFKKILMLHKPAHELKKNKTVLFSFLLNAE